MRATLKEEIEELRGLKTTLEVECRDAVLKGEIVTTANYLVIMESFDRLIADYMVASED